MPQVILQSSAEGMQLVGSTVYYTVTVIDDNNLPMPNVTGIAYLGPRSKGLTATNANGQVQFTGTVELISGFTEGYDVQVMMFVDNIQYQSNSIPIIPIRDPSLVDTSPLVPVQDQGIGESTVGGQEGQTKTFLPPLQTTQKVGAGVLIAGGALLYYLLRRRRK